MRSAFVIFIAGLLFWSGVPSAEAKLRKATYIQEISKIDWQLLNWTAAWRGTKKPADPFILERMEYDRDARQVEVYLNGDPKEATDENLQKSISGITAVLQDEFPDFEPRDDLIVHYSLKSEEDNKTLNITYKDGTFSRPDATSSASPAY